MSQVRTLHFAELLLHQPFPTVQQVELVPGETKEQAMKRFARVFGDELTAVAFYDRVELKTGGLTFLSEVINMSKSIRVA